MTRRRWTSSVAASVVIAMLGLPAVAATSLGRERVPAAPPGTPLPECRYDDVPTRYTGRSQWAISLVDPIRRLPADYRPSRLASVSRAGLNGDFRVRRVMIDDLRAMARAARLADAKVAVISAYRSYSQQKALFRREVKLYRREAALRRVARAGHSEHQLGTALDFRSASSTRLPWAYDDWARTRPGRWMKERAWEYGFVMSYPDGERETTCYRYEPWHYRYVGRELARALRQSGDTLREYLWEHHETAPSTRPRTPAQLHRVALTLAYRDCYHPPETVSTRHGRVLTRRSDRDLRSCEVPWRAARNARARSNPAPRPSCGPSSRNTSPPPSPSGAPRSWRSTGSR